MRLRELRLTLAVAESCTGGLAGSRITDVAGSSDYFLGGVIAYANSAKEELLSVRPETLVRFGAVSESAAREMAAGVRCALGADIGLAVTGIAGPGGATAEKPVGLMWLALSAENVERTRRLLLEGDRLRNKADAAEALLSFLEEFLSALPR
jgi:PncC family amidohydrolase